MSIFERGKRRVLLKQIYFGYVARPASLLHKLFLNPINRRRYKKRKIRKLEIGPGPVRIAEFETLNIRTWTNVDFVGDAARKLPFKSEVYDLIYASHILEHVPWYQVENTLAEWKRVLKPSGVLELWVPDGLKISQAFVAAELEGGTEYKKDGWWYANSDQDSCVWMAGRCFSYGDGNGRADSPNWHRGLFSERYLAKLLSQAGFENIERLSAPYDVRGYDHGWINLGMRAKKSP